MSQPGFCGKFAWLVGVRRRVACPLTPDPSPPFHGGEGRILCFCSCENKVAPLAPGRGEGSGVRGEDSLEAGFAEPRMSTDAGCFFATDEHGFSRMNQRGFGVLSFPLSRVSFLWHGRHAPSPPAPLPRFTGARGGFCVFCSCENKVTPLAPGRGEGSGVRGEAPVGSTWAICQCRATHHAVNHEERGRRGQPAVNWCPACGP